MRIDLVALGGAHETAGRQHHRHRLVGNERGLIDRLGSLALDDLGAPIVAVLVRIGANLAGDQLAQLGLAGQQRLDVGLAPATATSARRGSSSPRASRGVAAAVLRISSACSSESLKRFMSTGFGSSSRRMMRITSSRFRKAISKPVEDVQPPLDLVEAVLQAPGDRRDAELEPLRQHLAQTHDRAAGHPGR